MFAEHFNELHKAHNLYCQNNFGECRFTSPCEEIRKIDDMSVKFLLQDEYDG